MKIKRFVVGENMQNTYLAIDKDTGEGILIDAGSEGEKIASYIKENNVKLQCIILTHAHYDHIGACKYIMKEFNVPLWAGSGEEVLLEHCENNLSIHLSEKIELKADKILNDDEILNFGKTQFKIISTPGHTPGGICLYFEKKNCIFTGDTLFYGTIGRTDLPYGDTDELLNSLQKLKDLPDETKVFSGHGQETTIGDEKFHNPYLSDREVL